MAIALVFDMDDTLYPEYEYVYSGFEAVGKYIYQFYGLSHFADICLAYFQQGIRQHVFDQALKACGLEAKVNVSDLVDTYRKHTPNIALHADAIEVLGQLKERQDIHIALITDGYLEVQRQKFLALKLQQYAFASVIFTDEYGKEHWKPSVFAFRLTQTRLPSAIQKFVYIGDNLNKDFYAPNVLGWDSVYIKRDAEHDIYANSHITSEAFRPKRIINNLLSLMQIYKEEL